MIIQSFIYLCVKLNIQEPIIELAWMQKNSKSESKKKVKSSTVVYM